MCKIKTFHLQKIFPEKYIKKLNKDSDLMYLIYPDHTVPVILPVQDTMAIIA